MAEPVKCPACGLGLRGIPEGRRLLVTCSPKSGGCGTKFYHPPPERSTIAFRCARDGTPFFVTFKRDSPRTKFMVDKVTRPAANGTDAAPSELGSYAADVYDIHNFFCPCCGYVPEFGSGQVFYVECGKCHALVCGSLVYDKQDSPTTTVKWFVCYPECGEQGALGRQIEEYRATRSTSAARLAVPSLPQPDRPSTKKLGKG